MERIGFNCEAAEGFLSRETLNAMKDEVMAARDTLVNGTGAGNDFLGWIDLPEDYDREELVRIKAAAEKIRKDSDVLVAVGIGGSYLGAKAAIDFLKGVFYNNNAAKRGDPEIYFAGNNMSAAYLQGLLEVIGDRDFSLNIISKSGTTTEPAVAFRILKQRLIEKYGREEAAKRIYATTDRSRGALKSEADAEGYETFVVPDDIGGRYSVLTAVGLLPIAVCGADLDALLSGAAEMRRFCLEAPYEENGSLLYAAARNALYRDGKAVELLADYEPRLHNMAEWWKQLQGESEGKDGKGLFPAAVDLTTDLHSMGQYIQDGVRLLFETVLAVEESFCDFTIREQAEDLDGLNYLAGRTLCFANRCAMEGTLLAHRAGRVPNLRITVPRFDERSLGALFYFFEFECGVSGYMLGVNPFDQPGVEAYKKNMFRLLGKPGYVD